MPERNVNDPNFWDRVEAEINPAGGDPADFSPYNLENLQSLGVTVWEVDDLRKQALKSLPAVQRQWLEDQKKVVPADQHHTIKVPRAEDLFRTAALQLREAGKIKGSQIWDEIYHASVTEKRRGDEAAMDTEFADQGWLKRTLYGGTDLAATAVNARLFGAVEPVAELVAEAGQKVLGGSGLVFAGDDRADETFAGGAGYRKARGKLSDDIKRFGSLDVLGLDLNIGAQARSLAELYGFMGGAGALGRGATGRLARMTEAEASRAGLSKAGLMFLAGTTPKAAAKALQGQRVAARALGPARAGAKKLGEKAVQGTLLGQVAKSAANFGAYNGLRGMVEAAGEGANVAAQTGDPDEAIHAFAERAKQIGPEYISGLISGATFPFLQRFADKVGKSFSGALGQMGASSKNLFAKRFKEMWQLAPQKARGFGANLTSKLVAGPIEFAGFGFMPHLDAENQLHFQTFEDLLSDDPQKRLVAMQGIMGHAVNGMFVKGMQALRVRNGEAPPPRAGEIDWFATFRTKEIVRVGQSGRVREPTPEEKALEDAHTRYLARSGLQFANAPDKVVQETIRLMGEALERLGNENPDLAEQMAFELAGALAADAALRSRLNKGLSAAGGKGADTSLLPSYALGEFRRRLLDKADAARDRDSAEARMADALDRLQDAKGDLHPDWQAANPDVQRITAEIEQLQAVMAQAQGRLAPEQGQALEAELANLSRSLEEAQAVGFGVYEQAKAEFIQATYDRIKEMATEERKAKQKDTKAREEFLKTFELEGEVDAAVTEGATAEATGKPAKGVTKELADRYETGGKNQGFNESPDGVFYVDSFDKNHKLEGEYLKKYQDAMALPTRAEQKAALNRLSVELFKRHHTPKPAKPAKPDAEAQAKEKERAETEAKSKAILDDQRATVPEKASAAKVAEGLRVRAQALDASAAQWPLRAAEILEKLGDARVREILHESGAAGLKREGISEKLAREIRDILGVPLKKATPPSGKKAPGKKPKIDTSIPLINRGHFPHVISLQKSTAEQLAKAKQMLLDRITPEERNDPLVQMYLKLYDTHAGIRAIDDMLRERALQNANKPGGVTLTKAEEAQYHRLRDRAEKLEMAIPELVEKYLFESSLQQPSLADVARAARAEAGEGVPTTGPLPPGEKAVLAEKLRLQALHPEWLPGKIDNVARRNVREGFDSSSALPPADRAPVDIDLKLSGEAPVSVTELANAIITQRAKYESDVDLVDAARAALESGKLEPILQSLRERRNTGIAFDGKVVVDAEAAPAELADLRDALLSKAGLNFDLAEKGDHSLREYARIWREEGEAALRDMLQRADYAKATADKVIDVFRGEAAPAETITVYHAGKLEGETITGAEGQLHVGSLAAAQYIQERTGSRAPHIFSTELTLDPARILRMIDSVKGHGAGEVAEDVKAWFEQNKVEMPPKLGELLDQVIHLYTKEAKADNAAGMTAAARRLVAGLKKLGYDAIAYENRNEDAGHTSYIILEPDLTKFKNIMEPPPEAKDSVVKTGKAHAIIEGLIAKWKYGIPEKTNLEQVIGHVDTALKEAEAALEKLPAGPLRAEVARQQADLQNRKRWFEYEAGQRGRRADSERQAEVPEVDDAGKSTATQITEKGVELRQGPEHSLERFRARSSNELMESLELAAEKIPELRQNLPLILAGLEQGREFEQNPEAGKTVPLNVTFGDRIVARLGDGSVVAGMVVSEPRDVTPDAAGFIARRVKLWDGERVRSVRIADIQELTPETIRDVNTDVGIVDGVYRNGAEVTNSVLQRLVQPEPVEFPEHLSTAKDREQRRELLRGKGTVEDQRAQAELRQNRLRLLRAGEELHPEDWRLMAEQMLVPRADRKTTFGASSKHGRHAALAKALNAQAQGKALSKRDRDLIDSIQSTELDALAWMGEYHDPATARKLTLEELEAQAVTSQEAREDLSRYHGFMNRAVKADALLKESLSDRKKRDAGSFLALVASKGKLEHLLEWREWNEARGRVGRAKGKPPNVFATYMPETGTWLLRTAQSGQALEWVRDNIDANAASIKAFSHKARKMGRQLDSGKAGLAVMDRSRQLTELARAVVDTVMGWAHDGTLAERFTFARAGGVGEAAVQESANRKGAEAQLRELLGNLADKVDVWLEKNPAPKEAGPEFTDWAARFESFVTKGGTSLWGTMLTRIESGRHPVTDREAVFDEATGLWISRPEGKAGKGIVVNVGLPILPSKRMARDLVNLARRAAIVPQTVYGFVHGATADFTGAMFTTTVLRPLQALSRAVIGMRTGGPDSADTAFGWSPEATHSAVVHNRHLAAMDQIKASADNYVRGLVKKYDRQKLIELIRAEHEGKQPPELREFRKMMNDIATEMKKAGLVGSDFDARYDNRYVRLGRYTWKDPERLKAAMIAARVRAKEIGVEIAEFKAALDTIDGPPTDGQMQRLKEMQHEAVNQQRRWKSLEGQWKRSGRRLFKDWRAFNQVHNTPLDVADVRALSKWESSNRRRENDDWQWHVDRGLDLERPELLLWDSIMHHYQALETARFMKQIADDPRLSRSIRKAPKDWVLLEPEEIRSNAAFKHLAGRKVSPWVYHFIKLGEGPNGVAERITNDIHAAVKMSLTFASPANWVLQILANPLMLAVKAGSSIWRAYPEYMKALVELFIPGSRARLREKYGRMRFLDIATDADREFMHNLHSTNPDINTRTFMATLADTVNQFREGNVGAAVRGVGRITSHGPNRWLQIQSLMYRTFDAAGRVATYRLLRKQGKTREEAERAVVEGWDLFHQNKWGDFLRKGTVQVPGTKLKIPLPLLANSFGSVPVTFARNLGQIVGKTPLQLAELAATVALWNSAVQSWTGQSDDEVDALQRNVTPQNNDLLAWLRAKTTPLTPDGSKGIDLWNYHPVGAALEAIPGGQQAFWGAMEGASTEGLRGLIPGALEGTGPYGLTAEEDFVGKLTGSGHVLLAPYSDYLLDRDAKGAGVRWRHERPGLWGSQGTLQVAVEEGHLPLAIVYTLGSLANINPAFKAELSAMAGAVTQVAGQLDKTTAGSNTVVEIIADGEGMFEVRPRSWEDVLLRKAGLRVRNPDALRRLLEKIEAKKGIEKSTRTGMFRTKDTVKDAALRAQLGRLSKIGNDLKEARSGAHLWGMARHWMETRWEGYKDKLAELDPGEAPEELFAEDDLRAAIARQWSTPASRRRAAQALVTLGMGQEAGETLQILARMGLLVPKAGDKLPPVAPADVQRLFRAK